MNSDSVSQCEFEADRGVLSENDRRCYLYSRLNQIYRLQKNLHVFSLQDRLKLRKSIRTLERSVLKLLDAAECFPDSCDNCPGLDRCFGCVHREGCIGEGIFQCEK